MKKYQSPMIKFEELIFTNDVIMASVTVVDPITNGGNFNGDNYS